jgi:hypothetical protein
MPSTTQVWRPCSFRSLAVAVDRPLDCSAVDISSRFDDDADHPRNAQTSRTAGACARRVRSRMTHENLSSAVCMRNRLQSTISVIYFERAEAEDNEWEEREREREREAGESDANPAPLSAPLSSLPITQGFSTTRQTVAFFSGIDIFDTLPYTPSVHCCRVFSRVSR